MYGVEKVKELNIISCWEKNVVYKFLVVLFGLCGKEDIVNLNLYEKVYGLYGLIVGIIGLGKLEII